MKAHVLICSVAAAAVFVSVAGAARGDEPAKSNSSETTSSSAANAAALVRNLAGEWEGSIQSRNAEGMSSSSLVSACNRVEQNGRSLASVYEGFAFGQSVDGALSLSVNSSGQLASAFSRDGACLKSHSAKASDNALSASFDKSLPGLKGSKTEQVIKMTDANHYTMELYNIDAAGKKSLALKLEMTRLEPGQTSTAAASFDSSKALASARQGSDSSAVQTAGVDTP